MELMAEQKIALKINVFYITQAYFFPPITEIL